MERNQQLIDGLKETLSGLTDFAEEHRNPDLDVVITKFLRAAKFGIESLLDPRDNDDFLLLAAIAITKSVSEVYVEFYDRDDCARSLLPVLQRQYRTALAFFDAIESTGLEAPSAS